MTDWIEVSLNVTDDEAAEAISQELQRWCHQGVAIEQADFDEDTFDEDDVPPAQMLTVRGYFPDDSEADKKKRQIERSLRYMNMMYPMPEPHYRIIKEDDWATAWKQHYKPVRIGRHIVIRPLWFDEMDLQPDDIEIALDPGMAFGTGTHATTQLCLRALEDHMQPGLTVLDLGCGSGILSIAAAKMGAAKVVAVDTDNLAVKATQENAAQNHVAESIHTLQGSLENLLSSARRFDFIVVNILAKVILKLCENNLGQVVRPGGQAIFSGIIHDQVDEVEAALRQTGLEPADRRQQGDWVLITARRTIS
jgi:ribosomal protein L11 methyltransferase